MTRNQKINIFALCLLGFITTFSILSFIKGPHEIKPTISNRVLSNTNKTNQPPLLKIMTLNLAHGRKDGFHQFLLRKATIESNLNDIATVLQREQPAVVALQEADGPSWWSGNFNHVRYLADQANYAYSVQGEHVKGLGLSYGTALLSKLPLKDAVSLTFTYTPPTPAKGFLVSTLDTDIKINIVSVHLDFARSSVRHQQIEEMVNYLKPRGKPLIIMGDFNCEWTQETTLPLLAEQLNLHAYQPTATLMNTFPQPTKATRIDWILISAELEFVTYQVVEDILSDHLGTVATLKVN